MATITLLEPFLDFRCNLKGCCCKGWFIPFRPADLPRVLAAFDEEERAAQVSGWRFFVAEDGTLERFTFGRRTLPETGEADACQFLSADGRCGLQVEKGADVLPHLCRAFPAFAHEGIDPVGLEEGDAEGAVDLHFDVVCPEALNCLFDGDGPFRLVTVEAAPGSDLELRAARVMPLPPISIGEQTLTLAELRTIRRRIFAALGGSDRPALDRLAQVHYALARVAAGAPPASFAVRDDDPVGPFDGYLDSCVAIHGAEALARLFGQFRRLVFDLDLGGAAADGLVDALRADGGWRAAIDPTHGPRAPWLQPLLQRYLFYRFLNAFARSPAKDALAFTYGTIAHSVATAFRFAVGLARWLDRPVDRTVAKVAIGASEYVYRTVCVPPSAMPWFLPDSS